MHLNMLRNRTTRVTVNSPNDVVSHALEPFDSHVCMRSDGHIPTKYVARTIALGIWMENHVCMHAAGHVLAAYVMH